MNDTAEGHTGFGNDEPFEDPVTWPFECPSSNALRQMAV
jgi:hypothetical protein